MKKWVEMFTHFWKNKIYVLALSLTAACSYGFMIVRYAIGIDDTPYSYYFEEGLAAIVGRWVLYLLNKVLNIGEFAPVMTDLLGVLILMVAVTVWSTLFYSVLKEKVPWYGYLFFACIFLSCPLISEVYPYYLHNGISIGYLCSGISLCLFSEGISGRRLFPLAGSAVFLWIALGCYESFMMVWLLGVCLLLVTKRMCNLRDNVFAAIGMAGVAAACAMVLRSITISLITAVFELQYLQDEAVQRSVTELIGWLLEPDALSNFAMAIKRTYVMYVVFACAYYPIFVFVLATFVILAGAVWMSIRRKDIFIILLTIAGYVAAFSLIIIEGKETYYRAAQFLPVICGFGALLFLYGVHAWVKWLQQRKPRLIASHTIKIGVGINGVAVILLASVLWNQCADMNKWFYVDYQKYEVARETMNQVVYELEKNFDKSKPVVFTGIYEIPDGISKPAYVGYGTEEYFRMLNLTNWLDDTLLEKFFRGWGVSVAQMPTLSVLEWGRTAFGTNNELANFMKMHGYTLQLLQDADYEAADQLTNDLPPFPMEGSIIDAGDYIIVHF